MTTIIWAFLGGLLSFFSPCVLSVAPAYLGIISGSSVAELKAGTITKAKVFKATLAFVTGFTLIFVVLGVTSSLVGEVLRANRTLIAQISGVVVIFFGLHQGGWLKIAWFYQERRFHRESSVGIGGALLTGMAFSFGWTPCVGPILGSILALAGSEGEPLKGLLLLLIYSLGLALPFLLLAVGFEKMLPRFNRIKSYFRYLEWFAGITLIGMGILLVTGSLSQISIWFMQITGGWNPESWIKH